MSDNGWITESIVQFTRSPVWLTPVENFVDENCYIFTNDGEMKVEMTEVHMAFQKLMDELLTNFVQDIGVEMEKVFEAVHDSLHTDTAIKGSAKQFLNYIFYSDDFRSFHKMMVRRNLELDILALRALRRQEQGLTGEMSVAEEAAMDEEEALRLAIEASLEDGRTARKLMELEDIQIQEALALSIAAEEDRVRRVSKSMEKKEGLQTGVALEEEKERVVQKLEACALEMRKETIARGLTPKLNVPSSTLPLPSSSDVPTGDNSPTLQTKQGCPEVLPAKTSSIATAPRVSPGKGFGFKLLPSIQPSFKQLEASLAKSVTAPPNEKLETKVEDDVLPNRPTLEEMQARAQYMREQREKILKQNKENREKELKEFTAAGGKANTKTSAVNECEKQMTVELARRLREDILREATK